MNSKPWPVVLTEERRHAGLSLYTAAAQLGTSPDHLRLCETGHRRIDGRLLVNALRLYGASIFTMQRGLAYEKANR